jgi:hypothetical protein
MPNLRAGQTVTFVNKVVTGIDDYGNDVYDSATVDVPGCAVSPGVSTQSWQGTEQISADVTVHAPPDTNVDLPRDQMIIDGVVYNVVGNPRGWKSPFTGTGSMLEILGREVTTGGAAT